MLCGWVCMGGWEREWGGVSGPEEQRPGADG